MVHQLQKEMEHFTFSDPAIKARMDKAVFLQVDVTANTADDQACSNASISSAPGSSSSMPGPGAESARHWFPEA